MVGPLFKENKPEWLLPNLEKSAFLISSRASRLGNAKPYQTRATCYRYSTAQQLYVIRSARNRKGYIHGDRTLALSSHINDLRLLPCFGLLLPEPCTALRCLAYGADDGEDGVR